MQGRRFGASSEQTQVLSEQFSLFNEAEALADPKVAEPDLEQITYKRRKQTGKREMDFSSLPTEQVVHELRSKERVYPECGGTLHRCGQNVVRRELVYVPAKYTVAEHIQAVYGCRRCERENGHVPMKKARCLPRCSRTAALPRPVCWLIF